LPSFNRMGAIPGRKERRRSVMLTFIVTLLACIVFPPVILAVLGYLLLGVFGGIVGLFLGFMVFE